MEETITILRVGTEEAVRSVNDLKENIKILKQNLGELEIGTQEYQDTLDELKVNQNALKDAMYATSASMEEVAAAATGTSQSYNSLVHRMAALKEEWRATNDEARRNELGKQIAEINQQLKDMDASVGNFQRNVGNYESGVAGLVEKFDKWGETLKMMPPTLGAAKESIGKVGETMQLVGKQPILGIIGLLAPIIMKITTALGENETAMAAVKKVMASLQPVFDILQGVIEKIAEGFSKVVEWLVEFIGQSEGVKNVISSIMGVGNAILQHLLAPVKTAIAGFKGLANIIKDVFTGNFSDVKKHAKEAGEGIADAWKEGFSFKSNFEEGKAAGGRFIDGVNDNKAAAKEAGKEIGKSIAEGIEEEYEGFVEDDPWAQYELDEAAKERSKERMDAWFEEQNEKARIAEETAARLAEDEKAATDAALAEIEARKQARKEEAKAALENTMAVADATSGMLSAIADVYESDEKNAEKNAKKIKALRIASATIDMLNGAVTAFSSAMQLGPVVGPIIGAANAAAVVATGIANINKIKSTSTSGGSSATPAAAAPAVVSAPDVDTNLQSVRNVTTASEEERLNRMAKDQRVYIVSSDIEAALDDSKTRVDESSF